MPSVGMGKPVYCFSGDESGQYVVRKSWADEGEVCSLIVDLFSRFMFIPLFL